MSAACFVLRASVFDAGGIIRVTGARRVGKRRVILRARVAVSYYRCDRRAAGDAVFYAGEEFRHIRLRPRGRPAAVSRRAPGKETAELVHVYPLPCRYAVHGHADGGGMRLTEYGNMQIFTVAAAHNAPPCSCPRSSQKRG